MARLCDIPGCERNHHAKGLCQVHNGRLRYHGDPMAGGRERMVRAPIADRFWSLVTKGAPGECWPWAASITPNGYGQFFRQGRLVTAHRVALELASGVTPADELDVDHLCHNADKGCTDVPCAHRACCNPSHLEAVTHQVNVLRGRKFARTGTG